MSGRLSMHTIKMLSSQNPNETQKKTSSGTNNVRQQSQFQQNNNVIEYFDYDFCRTYYDQSDEKELILLSTNGVKNMNDLNTLINCYDEHFNWIEYSKMCEEVNEILVKKRYIENMNAKFKTDQILNIILIKTTNYPIESIFSDYQNNSVTISIISDTNVNITHHNIKKYIANKNNQTNLLNTIIQNNTSTFYMIAYDYYYFEHQFINKLIKKLSDAKNVETILLIKDLTKHDDDITENQEFFLIKSKFIRKIDDMFLCVINNDNKCNFTYSLSEVGVFLYSNQILRKYENVLATTDFIFKIINKFESKQLINDCYVLFDMYLSNIENDIIDEYTIMFDQQRIVESITQSQTQTQTQPRLQPQLQQQLHPEHNLVTTDAKNTPKQKHQMVKFQMDNLDANEVETNFKSNNAESNHIARKTIPNAIKPQTTNNQTNNNQTNTIKTFVNRSKKNKKNYKITLQPSETDNN